jgi:hypothetical protein
MFWRGGVLARRDRRTLRSTFSVNSLNQLRSAPRSCITPGIRAGAHKLYLAMVVVTLANQHRR